MGVFRSVVTIAKAERNCKPVLTAYAPRGPRGGGADGTFFRLREGAFGPGTGLVPPESQSYVPFALYPAMGPGEIFYIPPY